MAHDKLKAVLEALNERAEPLIPSSWNDHGSCSVYLNTDWNFDNAHWATLSSALYKQILMLEGGKKLSNVELVEAALMLDCDCYLGETGTFYLM